MVGRWSLAVFLGMVLVAAPVAAEPELAKPAFVLKPAKGFIDDPFVIDSAGARLAVIRTDSASFALIELVDLASGQTTRAFAAGNPQQLFDRVLFAGGPESGVVVISKDASNGRRTAQHFGADGKPIGQVGPVTDFGTTTRGGVPILVGWDRRTAASGDTTYTVAQYKLDGLARVGKPRAFVISKDGMLSQPPLKVISWQDGYAQIVGQRPGGFDKAKDMRLPDRAVVFDALEGALSSEQEIGDVLGWAVATQIRRTQLNRTLFAAISDEQDAVQLIDALGRRTPLTLGTPVQNYERKSLAEQEDSPARTLYFSLTLDPLNPDALGRQKADKPYIDLYRVRAPRADARAAGAPETERILRAPVDERPVTWVVGGRYVALLKKHKTFSRGGSEIQVYALTAH